MLKSFCLIAGLAFTWPVFSQTIEQVEANKVTLPNGWSLTPVGRSLQLGDLPLNIAVTKSGKRMAVTNNGQSVQSIQLIDPKQEKILDNAVVAKCWYGLVFSDDGKKLYASGGNDNWILVYDVSADKLQLTDSIALGKKWPNKISPAGIALDDQAGKMYVVTKENNSLYIVDLPTRKTEQFKLEGEAYACVLSPNKKELYISCWGCDKLYVFDTRKKNIVDAIPVGDNPNELCLNKKGSILFVANANDNSVSVIDIAKRKVLETLNAALYPNSPSGSTTNGLALNEKENRLYIANADNNCLAVFDVSHPGACTSKGFIPVGWYPTNVKVIDGKLFVTNGKGFSSMANPYGPNPFGNKQQVIYQQGDPNKPKDVQYIAGLFKGTLSMTEEPTDAALDVYTQVVYRNTPYNAVKEKIAQGEAGNPVPRKVGDASPIKYVFYVIKENRTYDQVLGDMTEGNGDPRLVLFGEKVTPNQHAIARNFVLFDNFYVDGEVSMDGHNWTTGAYATDYLEKNWVTSYGGRGGSYDGEGNRAIANNKGGFIWDHCSRAGVSYRTYGEFADHGKANIPVLKDHLCTYYPGFNLGIPDTLRFGLWKRDFDSLLRLNAVPHFNTVRLGNDHTEGMRKGKLSPYAHVADNDLSVGMLVDYLSKSPIWKETAIFIVEDDAQNGADHVDAHRSTAYLAGGFVKRNFVDHTPYTTSSILRTMELILGLSPMTQYDAAATPMWRAFQANPDMHGFNVLPETVDMGERNTAMNEWQRRSEKFNLTKEDAVPDLEFNTVLWYGLKGESVPFPGPRRAAFFHQGEKKDDDD